MAIYMTIEIYAMLSREQMQRVPLPSEPGQPWPLDLYRVKSAQHIDFIGSALALKRDTSL